MPAAQTMNNDDLVPEGSRRFDCGHAGYGDVQLGYIVGDVGSNENVAVWVERRLRAAFNSNGRSYVAWLGCSYRRIPNEEGLAIRIVRVKLDGTTGRDESLNLCGESFHAMAPQPKRGRHLLWHRVLLFAFFRIVSPYLRSRPLA